MVSSKTAGATIKAIQTVFSRHGIPNTVVADNMPFNSAELKEFAKAWNFTVTTASPNFPQSSGLVKRNVQTIKKLIRKAKESKASIDLALLEYRNTPISGMNLLPAQLLMNGRLRSSLPMSESLLMPAIHEEARKQLTNRQQKQQKYYNRGTRPLPPLHKGDVVRYKKGGKWEPAIVLSKHEAPRSFYIQTAQGNILHRNRHHLMYTKKSPPKLECYTDDTDEISDTLTHQANTQAGVTLQEQVVTSTQLPARLSRYGRPIRPPARYRDMTDN